MEITLPQPRVVVTGETGTIGGTRFHTVLEALKLAKHLSSPSNIQTSVDGEKLTCRARVVFIFQLIL